jgi:hypothetical protein
MLAYRVQADAFGDLDADCRRLLDDAGSPEAAGQRAVNRDRLIIDLRPGTILAREWNGHMHRVAVLDDGFACNGKTYPSLSKVAFAITGTRWNGPRFFGLRDNKKDRTKGSKEARGKEARSKDARSDQPKSGRIESPSEGPRSDQANGDGIRRQGGRGRSDRLSVDERRSDEVGDGTRPNDQRSRESMLNDPVATQARPMKPGTLVRQARAVKQSRSLRQSPAVWQPHATRQDRS